MITLQHWGQPTDSAAISPHANSYEVRELLEINRRQATLQMVSTIAISMIAATAVVGFFMGKKS